MYSCCCYCYLVIVLGLLLLLVYIVEKIYSFLYDIPPIPKVDENCWWGPGEPALDDDISIKPFKIKISDQDLDDLTSRLSNARTFTPPLKGVHHEYGFNANLLHDITQFWQTKYNWREREAYLNQFPQYKTKIQGLDIHFLHVKPGGTTLKVLPLILLHGWPGCAFEFYECIPKLVKPNGGRNFIFEVVVPHIPGFAFSEAPARPGLTPTTVAVIYKKLMERLGFDQWYVQGGDWGFDIGTHMAILYPKKVLGLHLNMGFLNTPVINLKRFLGSFCPSLIVNEKNRSKMYPLTKLFLTCLRESGYYLQQATRPDTIGFALNDSPTGLAAYIIEKFIAWTHEDYILRPDGGLTLKFSYERLLDIVTVFWFSNSITTSMRFYADFFALANPYKALNKIPVQVPSAYGQFCNELIYMPETFLKEKFDTLLQYSELPAGGHFAAFEEPILFVEDVWNAVEKFEKYHTR